MARFLAYTSPARGHLYPIVATLEELRERGHEVHVRTLASEVEALRMLGLRAEPLAAAIEEVPLDDWRWRNAEEGLLGGLRTFARRAAHEIGDLERAIDEVGPDVLLVDVTTAGAAAVAEASGMPWAQWIPFFQHFDVLPLPPEATTLIPFTLHPEGLQVLNEPRRRLGLAPLPGPAEARRAPLYLYFTAPPFEDERFQLPPSFRLLGPGLWEPAARAPEWLDDLEAPVVLVTASSEYQRDDHLIRTVLAALAAEDVHVVATTAAHDPEEFDQPRNATVERWLPHGPLVARARCVICHGGMGITQRALAAGVPLCVVPFGRDQAEVARRVGAVGAGTHVSPDQLTPESLREGVRTAIGMRQGAERVAAGFARAGGSVAAADAVTALARGGGAGRTGNAAD